MNRKKSVKEWYPEQTKMVLKNRKAGKNHVQKVIIKIKREKIIRNDKAKWYKHQFRPIKILQSADQGI